MTFQPVLYAQKLKLLEGTVDTDMKFFKKSRNFKHLPQCSTKQRSYNKKAKKQNQKKELLLSPNQKAGFI
jgi:hypothetical protein